MPATESQLREAIQRLADPVREMLTSQGLEGMARAHEVERLVAAIRPVLAPPQPGNIDFERLAMFVNAVDDATRRRREGRDHAAADASLEEEWILASEFLALGL